MTIYFVPKQLRLRLRRPLGGFIPGERPRRVRLLRAISGVELFVTIGDATTSIFEGHGITPHLAIVDGNEKRLPRPLPTTNSNTTISVVNRAGTISTQSLDAIREAITSKPPVRIQVRGEEDLLTLPVIASFPENTVVFYGQPNKGMIFVPITRKKREFARQLLFEMGITTDILKG